MDFPEPVQPAAAIRGSTNEENPPRNDSHSAEETAYHPEEHGIGRGDRHAKPNDQLQHNDDHAWPQPKRLLLSRFVGISV
jgi:hypothetical protein